MQEEFETPLSLSTSNQHDDNVHENHKLCKQFFADITNLSFKLLVNCIHFDSKSFHDLYKPNEGNEN